MNHAERIDELEARLQHEVATRERLEKELQEKENRYQALVRALPDAMFSLNSEGVYLDYIPAKGFETLYPPEEFLGKSVHEIMPSDIAEASMYCIKEALRTNELQRFEYKLLLGEEWLHFEARLVPEENEPDSVLGVVREITAHKQAEEALRESQERFELAVRGSNDGLWDWPDITKDAEWWSPRWYELLGYEEGEVEASYSNFRAFLHPDDLKRMEEGVRAHFEERVPFDMEYRLRAKSGDYRWFRGRSQALWDDEGHPVRMSGSIQDITAHKQAEKKLRTTQEYLDTILLNLPVGIAILEGPEFRYYRINHRLAEINGLSVEDHLDRPLAEVLPAAAPDIIPGLRHVLETGEPRLDREFSTRLPKAPDVIRHFIDSFFPIKGADGKPGAVGAVVLDITARKQAEEALQRAYAELEQRVQERTAELTQSNAALHQEIAARKQAEETLRLQREELAHVLRTATMGELTAALAHEINQPLTAILSNAQAAKRFMDADTPDLDEIREILDDIINDDRRAAEVITRLRALLRKQAVATEPLDINAVVSEVTDLLHSDTVIKNVSIELDLAEGLPLVLGDRVQLQQVLLNLMMNSFDAMEGVPGRERILVIRTAREDEGTICVSVKDTGKGFGGQDADRLFEPFHTTKAEGMGMGLAINRSIIEAHGGKVWARENPDRGATFQFTLPVISEDKKSLF